MLDHQRPRRPALLPLWKRGKLFTVFIVECASFYERREVRGHDAIYTGWDYFKNDITIKLVINS